MWDSPTVLLRYTFSLLYKIKLIKNYTQIFKITQDMSSPAEILPNIEIIYTSAACDACDKYHVCVTQCIWFLHSLALFYLLLILKPIATTSCLTILPSHNFEFLLLLHSHLLCTILLHSGWHWVIHSSFWISPTIEMNNTIYFTVNILPNRKIASVDIWLSTLYCEYLLLLHYHPLRIWQL